MRIVIQKNTRRISPHVRTSFFSPKRIWQERNYLNADMCMELKWKKSTVGILFSRFATVGIWQPFPDKKWQSRNLVWVKRRSQVELSLFWVVKMTCYCCFCSSTLFQLKFPSNWKKSLIIFGEWMILFAADFTW